jgi:hypothetical protein
MVAAFLSLCGGIHQLLLKPVVKNEISAEGEKK